MSEESKIIRKLEPLSHGRADLRKRKPKRVAVIRENCTGCAGSPVCVEYCPVEACMFWLPDEDHPPFGHIVTDKTLCIGCSACNSRGPDGIFLEGCPWDAIEMVPIEQWEAEHEITMPDMPGPTGERLSVPEKYV